MNRDSPEELGLTFVPLDEREAVRNFDEEAEAELAAGFLRAQGIAAEVGPMIIPGLQSGMALWVHRDAAGEARRLLDEADARAHGPREVD
ncbi:MAG: hypothetical protein ACRD1Y_04625 [Terriglobales bacterium]